MRQVMFSAAGQMTQVVDRTDTSVDTLVRCDKPIVVVKECEESVAIHAGIFSVHEAIPVIFHSNSEMLL